MAFPARSVVLDSSVNEMLQLFKSRPDLSTLNYTAVVRIVLSHVRLSGLLLDVVDPVKFLPLPHCCVRQHALGPVVEGARSQFPAAPVAGKVAVPVAGMLAYQYILAGPREGSGAGGV